MESLKEARLKLPQTTITSCKITEKKVANV